MAVWPDQNHPNDFFKADEFSCKCHATAKQAQESQEKATVLTQDAVPQRRGT